MLVSGEIFRNLGSVIPLYWWWMPRWRTLKVVTMFTSTARWIRNAVALVWAVGMLWMTETVRSQLVITELMSKSSNSFRGASITNDVDFFELSNFTGQRIDLTGYRFTDSKDAKPFRRKLLPDGAAPVFVESGGSVVFVRSPIEVPSEEVMSRFREWWGDCLPPETPVLAYPSPGFSSFGDQLAIYGPDNRLVDRVRFPAATRGRSFSYDPATGEFGVLSSLGGNGCLARITDDIATPGVTTGPVPLRVLRQPTNVLACLGRDVTLRVAVAGLPRPRSFVWTVDNLPMDESDEPELHLHNVGEGHEGEYRVRISNGFSTVWSDAATLKIHRSVSSPELLEPLVDVTVVTNRTARFSVEACAYPAATYEWRFNGVVIPDQTERTLFIADCTPEISGAEICVRVRNELGEQTSCAHLYVTPQPDIRFTEVQAFPVTGSDCPEHHDWFELTNFGTNTVNLNGFRFSDTYTLDGAFTIRENVVIEPQESVVFVKSPSAGPFVDWWGAERLPIGVKLVAYAGFSLSRAGDAIYLWGALAEDVDEVLSSASFPIAQQGASFEFDQIEAPFGVLSEFGRRGAFRSQVCGDIGSPGYTPEAAVRLVRLREEAGGMRLTWQGRIGARYVIEVNSGLDSKTGWKVVAEHTATEAFPSWLDPRPVGSGLPMRFYRVAEIP